MKTIFLLIGCGLLAFGLTGNFVEFLAAYSIASLVIGFVSFAFGGKKAKKQDPPSDIQEIVAALFLIEDAAYRSIQNHGIRYRKGSYSREVEGLGIVSVEIDRRIIIRKIHSRAQDLLTANWISGWLAKHRDQVWVVHEIDSYTYEAILADW